MFKKLTERVYYMKYNDEKLRPSLGLVIGDNVSLAIDAGNSSEQVENFQRYVYELGVANLKYVGVTHWHWDHIYGLYDMELASIGSVETQERVQKVKAIAENDLACEEEEENTVKNLKKLIADKKEIGEVEVGYDKRMKLKLGGVTCIFEHLGGDHAEDSTLIYVESDQVMFLGDGTYRGFKGKKRYHSLENVRSMANKILKYDCKYYVTSHKEVYESDEMEAMLKRMVELGELVADAKTRYEVEDIHGNNFTEEDYFYIDAFIEGNRN